MFEIKELIWLEYRHCFYLPSREASNKIILGIVSTASEFSKMNSLPRESGNFAYVDYRVRKFLNPWAPNQNVILIPRSWTKTAVASPRAPPAFSSGAVDGPRLRTFTIYFSSQLSTLALSLVRNQNCSICPFQGFSGGLWIGMLWTGWIVSLAIGMSRLFD